jgi:hypothetical protein
LPISDAVTFVSIASKVGIELKTDFEDLTLEELSNTNLQEFIDEELSLSARQKGKLVTAVNKAVAGQCQLPCTLLKHRYPPLPHL